MKICKEFLFEQTERARVGKKRVWKGDSENEAIQNNNNRGLAQWFMCWIWKIGCACAYGTIKYSEFMLENCMVVVDYYNRTDGLDNYRCVPVDILNKVDKKVRNKEWNEEYEHKHTDKHTSPKRKVNVIARAKLLYTFGFSTMD